MDHESSFFLQITHSRNKLIEGSEIGGRGKGKGIYWCTGAKDKAKVLFLSTLLYQTFRLYCIEHSDLGFQANVQLYDIKHSSLRLQTIVRLPNSECSSGIANVWLSMSNVQPK